MGVYMFKVFSKALAKAAAAAKFAVFGIILGSQAVHAGTWEMVENYPEGGCVEIPADTMCLSACAFGWLKASKRINRGVVGFHLPYDPKTNETTMGMQLVARNFMFERGYLMLWNELAETTPSDFVFMKADATWSGNWREARGNLKVTSDPRSLKRC